MRDPVDNHRMSDADISAALFRLGTQIAGRPPQGDHLIEVAEAATILGVSPDFLYKHKEDYPFMLQLGTNIRCSYNGIQRWIAKETR